MQIRLIGPATGFLALAITCLALPSLLRQPTVQDGLAGDVSRQPVQRFIIESTSLDVAAERVRSVGGRVTHELHSIDAVGAELTPEQTHHLAILDPSLRLHRDNAVAVSSTSGSGGDGDAQHTAVTTRLGAHHLHRQGIDGRGVTVAVLDTGLWAHDALLNDGFGAGRLLAQYDARADVVRSTPIDENGHGTHVTSILASSATASDATYHGVAPNVDLVSIAAFDRDGYATYADVIRGIEWAVEHRATYDIQVLALAFSAPTQLPYWQDPLARAVMVAWHQGLVVVASSGNRGPAPKTLGVPGNVPYVITVGGVGDDALGSFSSAGPTEDDFIKPEVVAPGVQVSALMAEDHQWATDYPAYYDDEHFTMSGTSQAMAAAAGVTALILQTDPGLSPDDVKCRLISSSRAAIDPQGQLAYSVFQQGAGLVDAVAAVAATETACANRGLDIVADLDGSEHYRGPARELADGSFIIEGGTGTWDASLVSGSYAFTDTTDPLATLAETDGTPWIDEPVGGGDPFWIGGPGLESVTTAPDVTTTPPTIAIQQWVETP